MQRIREMIKPGKRGRIENQKRMYVCSWKQPTQRQRNGGVRQVWFLYGADAPVYRQVPVTLTPNEKTDIEKRYFGREGVYICKFVIMYV